MLISVSTEIVYAALRSNRSTHIEGYTVSRPEIEKTPGDSFDARRIWLSAASTHQAQRDLAGASSLAATRIPP
jgi:hypothetical protein